MTLSANPAVSVIVPVHNGGEVFAKCLAAWIEANPAPRELIVVADGATDGSAERAEASGAKVIRIAARSGPAQARNLGAREACGEILFFVDADVVVRPDVITRVVEIFARDPELAAAFGSYDDAPGAPNFLSQYKNLFHHYVHQTGQEEASTFWSGCGAIRREVLVGIGGFDTDFSRPAIEDIELGTRLRRAGHRIRLVKSLQVKHLKRWDAISLVKADLIYRALPWTELILRDRCLINDLNLQTSSRISVALVYLFLASLAAAWLWPGLLVIALTAAFLLLAFNARLYRFFLDKRGWWFVLRAIPWHWFYYFYSGLAFAVGTVRYLFRGRHLPRTMHVAGDESLAHSKESSGLS